MRSVATPPSARMIRALLSPAVRRDNRPVAFPVNRPTPAVSRPVPPVAPVKEGVARYRYQLNGRTAWYSFRDYTSIIRLRTVEDGEDEGAIVAELLRELRGEQAGKPTLTLYRPTPSVSSASLLPDAPPVPLPIPQPDAAPAVPRLA